MAFDPSKYTVAKARPLPVILLLDRSGSMSGEKISSLNAAVNDMIQSFKTAGNGEVEINLAVISFGDGGASYDLPLQPAKDITGLVALKADGGTPMGMALRMAKDLIEDRSVIPSKGYRPAVVLVSDGEPNDDWQEPMDAFISGGRTAKCQRFAMAIGTSQDDPVLNRFLSGSGNKVFLASDAGKIRDFFTFLTMTVTTAMLPAATGVQPASSVTDLAKELGIL